MLGAAHMTMAKHFDMDELLEQLVTTKGNKGKSKVHSSLCFPLNERKGKIGYLGC